MNRLIYIPAELIKAATAGIADGSEIMMQVEVRWPDFEGMVSLIAPNMCWRGDPSAIDVDSNGLDNDD